MGIRGQQGKGVSDTDVSLQGLVRMRCRLVSGMVGYE